MILYNRAFVVWNRRQQQQQCQHHVDVDDDVVGVVDDDDDDIADDIVVGAGVDAGVGEQQHVADTIAIVVMLHGELDADDADVRFENRWC